MSHYCHATNCEVNIPPEMFMCKQHWFMLTKSLRSKIWKTYEPGQCESWSISNDYADAAIECVTFIANLEGVIPDIKLYEMLRPEKK